MEEAGLETRRDAAGSLDRLASRAAASWRPIVVGSHIDTVERRRALRRSAWACLPASSSRASSSIRSSAVELAHPLELVEFTAEEPNAYGSSCIGSRAWAGVLLDDALLAQTEQPTARAARRSAARPRRRRRRRSRGRRSARPGLDRGLHRAPHRARAGAGEPTALDVGVVSGIVGIRRLQAMRELVGPPTRVPRRSTRASRRARRGLRDRPRRRARGARSRRRGLIGDGGPTSPSSRTPPTSYRDGSISPSRFARSRRALLDGATHSHR